MPSEQDAWKFLSGEHSAIPAWATALVQPLPKTTLSMLDLDRLHRSMNPLGPRLAGELRWVAADAIGCEYARRYAESDLLRSGLTSEDIKNLADQKGKLADSERAALAFARKLTLAAYSVTDDEVAALLKLFSPEELVAIVHTVAYANFQNRIFLALGVGVEPGGPCEPLELPIDQEKRVSLAAPARPPWELLDAARSTAVVERPDWDQREFSELVQSVDRQKRRTSRVPPPDPSRFANLPPEVKGQATKIVWSNISMGYQPQLTGAWFECMGTFQRESQLDRVFSNSVFWVITRTNDCFY